MDFRVCQILLVLFLSGFIACKEVVKEEDIPVDKRFTTMPVGYTGIDFTNQLDFKQKFNIYTYRNFYNGGGVAIGDLNKDGLPDLYFTANMKSNRLYLNKGNFQFEDITEKAGVKGERAWSTGVSFADVNGDGWLDIYVCNSGNVDGDNKQNELYINNGDLTFTESAAKYGLDDRGLSTHAAFFDYDKDGDLDVYLLNNSYQAIGSFNLRKNIRPVRDSVGGDKLYRNDGNQFVDVSEAAGIYGSVIGFGLGVTVGDVDQDGWQDIYVSNDFFERDYLYMNNGDGTFREELEKQIRSISGASMGADMADLNNDGYPEIFVTEMLPETDARLKTKTTFENWDRYQYGVKNGYYHQFTRNMLHLNNGDGSFSEIGRLVDVEATDWSWGALFEDFNNDGKQDIFVANGIYQNLTDQDFLNFIANEETKQAIITQKGVDFKKLVEFIPVEAVPNYMFVGKGDLQFSNQSEDWGLAAPSHSNGSAYGDLDNDGDLDLVVNNVNMPAFIYRNETSRFDPTHNYLSVSLKGEGENTFALGAKVTLRAEGKIFHLEHMPMRGFQSSMDYRLFFGLGTISNIDTLEVLWPNGQWSQILDVKTNRQLVLDYKELKKMTPLASEEEVIPVFFREKKEKENWYYQHEENSFVDFDRDNLLYHMKSTEGPKIAKGDVNGDGREDFYIGGAKGKPGALMIQQANGQFSATNLALFEKDKGSEDVDGLFFDADGDQDLDLYVVSGGNEFPSSSASLIDRLYLNNGQGQFTKSEQVLPAGRFESTSCVVSADYDKDGDQDLFVGVRLMPRFYGVQVNGYILENDGRGRFTNISDRIAPGLKDLGLIKDAIWADYDQDEDVDLLIVGEWMNIKVFQNENGTFKDVSKKVGVAESSGWWNRIVASDLDKDGDLDFILGNHGLNSRFKANKEQPISCYINDFDQNGTVEQIICTYNEGESYPLVLRQDLVRQMPGLKKKYLKFANYKGQKIEDIFTPEQLERAVVHQVNTLESAILINQGNGQFVLKALPVEAQLSPTYGILAEDFNKDGHVDILLGGNLFGVKPEVGRYDASYGTVLLGNSKNEFSIIDAKASGFKTEGEVRDIVSIKAGNQRLIVVARNNAEIQVFEQIK